MNLTIKNNNPMNFRCTFNGIDIHITQDGVTSSAEFEQLKYLKEYHRDGVHKSASANIEKIISILFPQPVAESKPKTKSKPKPTDEVLDND